MTKELRAKKRKRRKNKLRFYRYNILLALIIFIIIAGVLIYTFCNVNNVDVEGNTILSADEIEEYVLNDKYSKNAVYCFLKAKVHPTRDIPFVQSYDVRLKDRNSIVIEVEEETMLGYVAESDGSFAYFDDEGQVVEISSIQVDGVMPLQGVVTEDAKVGEVLPLESKQLDLILSLTKNLKKYDLYADGIAFNDSGDLYILIDTVLINFGDGDEIASKVMRLPHILPSLSGMAGILHLENFSLDNTDIVFEKTN